MIVSKKSVDFSKRAEDCKDIEEEVLLFRDASQCEIIKSINSVRNSCDGCSLSYFTEEEMENRPEFRRIECGINYINNVFYHPFSKKLYVVYSPSPVPKSSYRDFYLNRGLEVEDNMRDILVIGCVESGIERAFSVDDSITDKYCPCPDLLHFGPRSNKMCLIHGTGNVHIFEIIESGFEISNEIILPKSGSEINRNNDYYYDRLISGFGSYQRDLRDLGEVLYILDRENAWIIAFYFTKSEENEYSATILRLFEFEHPIIPVSIFGCLEKYSYPPVYSLDSEGNFLQLLLDPSSPNSVELIFSLNEYMKNQKKNTICDRYLRGHDGPHIVPISSHKFVIYFGMVCRQLPGTYMSSSRNPLLSLAVIDFSKKNNPLILVKSCANIRSIHRLNERSIVLRGFTHFSIEDTNYPIWRGRKTITLNDFPQVLEIWDVETLDCVRRIEDFDEENESHIEVIPDDDETSWMRKDFKSRIDMILKGEELNSEMFTVSILQNNLILPRLILSLL